MKITTPLRIAAISLAVLATTPASIHASGRGEASAVVNPTVPKKVKFADKDIELDRIDMAERLDRELTAMAYTHAIFRLSCLFSKPTVCRRIWPILPA